MDPYMNLAHGIILQAVKDYRTARHKLKQNPRYEPARAMKRECERFFRSDWFSVLTDLDGEELIHRLNREAA